MTSQLLSWYSVPWSHATLSISPSFFTQLSKSPGHVVIRDHLWILYVVNKYKTLLEILNVVVLIIECNIRRRKQKYKAANCHAAGPSCSVAESEFSVAISDLLVSNAMQLDAFTNREDPGGKCDLAIPKRLTKLSEHYAAIAVNKTRVGRRPSEAGTGRNSIHK